MLVSLTSACTQQLSCSRRYTASSSSTETSGPAPARRVAPKCWQACPKHHIASRPSTNIQIIFDALQHLLSPRSIFPLSEATIVREHHQVAVHPQASPRQRMVSRMVCVMARIEIPQHIEPELVHKEIAQAQAIRPLVRDHRPCTPKSLGRHIALAALHRHASHENLNCMRPEAVYAKRVPACETRCGIAVAASA